MEVFERAVTEGINNELNKKSETLKLPKKTANTEEQVVDASTTALDDVEDEVREMEWEVLE